MKCPNCGYVYDKPVKFCTKCGKSMLKAELSEPKCEKCGKLFIGNEKFCTSCGTKRNIVLVPQISPDSESKVELRQSDKVEEKKREKRKNEAKVGESATHKKKRSVVPFVVIGLAAGAAIAALIVFLLPGLMKKDGQVTGTNSGDYIRETQIVASAQTEEPIETESPFEIVETSATEEPIETESPFEIVETSATEEPIETESIFEIVETSATEEPIETEAPEPTATEAPVLTLEIITPEPTAIETAAPTPTEEMHTSEPTYRVLSPGDTGPEFEKFRDSLAELGYNHGSLTYDTQTMNQVKLFQIYNDLDVTGVADADTQRVLYSGDALSVDDVYSSIWYNCDESSFGTDPLSSQTADASSYLVENGSRAFVPKYVVENNSKRCWAAQGPATNDVGEWISLTTPDYNLIGGFKIRNGYQMDNKRYNGNYRPSQLLIYADDVYVTSVDIPDRKTTFYFRFSKPIFARSVRFVIADVYETSHDTDTCITELRLLGYNGGSVMPEPVVVTTAAPVREVTPSGRVYVVEDVNVRSAPNKSGSKITVIYAGKYIEYLGETSTDERGVDWYKITSPNGHKGWVSSKCTRLEY